MNTKIILAGLGVAAVAGFGILQRLFSERNSLECLVPLPRIHKIDLTG